MAAEEQLGVCVLVLTTDQTPMDRGLTQARGKADAAGAAINKTMAGHMASMSKSMGKVGSEMTRNVTLPIVGLGAAAVKMGADFDAAMERVHTQSGASQKEVDNLKGKVLELAKVSPQGPVELANALYRLEGAGYRGAAAMNALKAASQLAAVGNANVEDTAKTLTQVLKPGIKGVKDMHDAAAQMNATIGAGDLKLPALVDALGTGVVTSAKQAGLSFKDVTAALAVFGDETNNVSGWSAQLATAFHFLTNPTAKASDALKSIGMQSDQLSSDMDKPQGLLVALRDLKSHLSELPADKAKQILGDILPGGRGRVLTVLLNQTDLLTQKYKQIQDTSSNFGEAVAKTQQTTANKIKVAWSTIQTDAVQLGEALGPDFLKVGEGVANEADKIATAFLKLPAAGCQQLQHEIRERGRVDRKSRRNDHRGSWNGACRQRDEPDRDGTVGRVDGEHRLASSEHRVHRRKRLELDNDPGRRDVEGGAGNGPSVC